MSFLRILKKVAQIAILLGFDKKLKNLIVKKVDDLEEKVWDELEVAKETRDLIDPEGFVEVDTQEK